MLIESDRWRPGDRAAWDRAAAGDLAWSRTDHHADMVDLAETAVVQFARRACTASVSWGKDSTVVAHMVATLAPAVPLVWVRLEPMYSPECLDVRDAFLRTHPRARYDERVIHRQYREDGSPIGGTLQRAMRSVSEHYGTDRRISGVRAQESGERRLSGIVHGVTTDRVCNPLTWWTARDVWAYLAAHDLPIHPAYAMTFGGSLDRDRLRVGPLGSRYGRAHGRLEWEQAYYPEQVGGRGDTPESLA